MDLKQLQRLQLSADLERALDLEFAKHPNKESVQAQMMSSKFDINEYMNSLFPDGMKFINHSKLLIRGILG
jgi:hypothetical protein